jgi:hypothetical protein
VSQENIDKKQFCELQTQSHSGSSNGQKDLEQQQPPPPRLHLGDCVKVAYKCGNVFDIMAGSEARLPLQAHELQQVSSSLATRYLLLFPFRSDGLTNPYYPFINH